MSKQSNAVDFITHWMHIKKSNGTMDDVGRRLGISRQAVQFKVTRLRSWGVKLPNLKNNVSNPYDVNELNRLIAELDK